MVAAGFTVKNEIPRKSSCVKGGLYYPPLEKGGRRGFVFSSARGDEQCLGSSSPRGIGGIGLKGRGQGIAHPVGLLAVVGQDAFLEQEV